MNMRLYLLFLASSFAVAMEPEKTAVSYTGFVSDCVRRDVVFKEAAKIKCINQVVDTNFDKSKKDLIWDTVPPVVQKAVRQRYYTAEYERYVAGCKKYKHQEGSIQSLCAFLGVPYQEHGASHRFFADVRTHMPQLVLLRDIYAALPADAINVITSFCYTDFLIALRRIHKNFERETISEDPEKGKVTALDFSGDTIAVGYESGSIQKISINYSENYVRIIGGLTLDSAVTGIGIWQDVLIAGDRLGHVYKCSIENKNFTRELLENFTGEFKGLLSKCLSISFAPNKLFVNDCRENKFTPHLFTLECFIPRVCITLNNRFICAGRTSKLTNSHDLYALQAQKSTIRYVGAHGGFAVTALCPWTNMQFVSGGTDGGIHIWELGKDAITKVVTIREAGLLHAPVCSLARLHNGALLCGIHKGLFLYYIGADTKKCMCLNNQPAREIRVISPQSFCVGGQKGDVVLYASKPNEMLFSQTRLIDLFLAEHSVKNLPKDEGDTSYWSTLTNLFK